MDRARHCLVISLTLAVAGCTSEVAPPEPTPITVDKGHPPIAAEPAFTVGNFFIELPADTLQPGEETFPCWIFPLEITGPSLLVGGGKLTTQPGMHHGNITTRPITEGTGIRPCGPEETGAFGGEADDILHGGAVLFASSTQVSGEEWQSFPDGMGFPVADGYEIVARMHYLNSTQGAITVAPRYDWYTIDESKVVEVLGPFAWALTGWEIPPKSTYTAETVCHPPKSMNWVNVLPHMHKLGNSFFAEYVGGELDGQRFLDSVGYDPDNGVVTQYTPAIDIGLAEGVRFGCTWTNTFDKTIVEGVGDNEMCILFGYAYPYEQSYSASGTVAGCALAAAPEPGQ